MLGDRKPFQIRHQLDDGDHRRSKPTSLGVSASLKRSSREVYLALSDHRRAQVCAVVFQPTIYIGVDKMSMTYGCLTAVVCVTERQETSDTSTD